MDNYLEEKEYQKLINLLLEYTKVVFVSTGKETTENQHSDGY